MLYLLIIGFIVVAIFGTFASSRNVRKAQEAELEALKQAQKASEFSHNLSLRKASLFDEFRASDQQPWKGMSDNQLAEFIEINLRKYNKSKEEVPTIGFGFFVILAIIAAAGAWYLASWPILWVGAGISAAVSIFLAVKMSGELDKEYQEKGFTLDQLRVG